MLAVLVYVFVVGSCIYSHWSCCIRKGRRIYCRYLSNGSSHCMRRLSTDNCLCWCCWNDSAPPSHVVFCILFCSNAGDKREFRGNWEERFYNRTWRCWSSDANAALTCRRTSVCRHSKPCPLLHCRVLPHGKFNIMILIQFLASLEVWDWQLNSSVGDWTVSSKLWPNGTIEILLLLLLLLLYHCHHRHYH